MLKQIEILGINKFRKNFDYLLNSEFSQIEAKIWTFRERTKAKNFLNFFFSQKMRNFRETVFFFRWKSQYLSIYILGLQLQSGIYLSIYYGLQLQSDTNIYLSILFYISRFAVAVWYLSFYISRFAVTVWYLSIYISRFAVTV